MNREQKQNKELTEKYPFLLPRNWQTDRVPDAYEYEYTELDIVPEGWKKAFGLNMVEELRVILVKADYLEAYRVHDIKEKYGSLRWYDNFGPVEHQEEYYAWLRRYEDLSERICIICGEPATHRSTGWISPYCEKCVAASRKPNERFKRIDS